jgi:hypothetical protein
LTQNPQVDPAVRLRIPKRALELTQILGQPCEFQVSAAPAAGISQAADDRSMAPWLVCKPASVAQPRSGAACSA